MSVSDDDAGGGVDGDSDQGWWSTTTKAKHQSVMGLLKILVHKIHDFFLPFFQTRGGLVSLWRQ